MSTYTTTSSCVNYLEKDVSTTSDNKCKLAGTICYLPKSNCVYDYATTDNTDDLKLA